MTIHTDITPEDWNAFVRFLSKRATRAKPGRRFAVALGTAVLLALAAGAMLSFAPKGLDPISFVAGAVVILLWLITITRFRVFRLGPSPGGIVLGPRAVSLNGDGIRSVTQNHEALFCWPSVRSVELTSQHLFLMVDANAAIIIPQRAFIADGERNDFVVKIRSHIIQPQPSSHASSQ